ncbi:MAG: FAD-dependent oxidoreductase [Pseudomonadota bacterium]
MTQKQVIVVGGGIIGASIAFHLVEAGARVTLIEAGELGGIVSPCSFGWTNASHKNTRPYFNLRYRSMHLWDDLAARLPNIPYRKTEVLYLDGKTFDLDAFYANHTGWDYPLEWLDGEQIGSLEPGLAVVPERGILSTAEGAVEAAPAAVFFAKQAEAAGARIMTNTEVTEVILEGDTVKGVIAGEETLSTDEVIIAAGNGTKALAAMAGIEVPMYSKPGLLISTSAVSHRVQRMILAEEVHFRQRADGTLSAGEDFGGGSINDNPEDGSQMLLERIRNQLVDNDGIELSGYTVGHRPIPADDHPIVGRPTGRDGLYIAVMHSGATLAPVVGNAAAAEILRDERDPLLATFGMDRFDGEQAAATVAAE